ncbi:MAG: dTDP-4-dehydrorhamnose 3,5-epimerase [Rikenellaceae bacterium]
MNIIKTDIEGVFIIEPKVLGDERGYFMECFRDDCVKKHIGDISFVQDNESCSGYGVLRGLHFQKEPYAQTKLVRVITGEVLDVAVDIRKGSPTYGKHVAVKLSSENKRQLFIPKGFAHGYAVLSENAIFSYKCDQYYHPECEGGIAYDDEALEIDWMLLKEDLILSTKDKHHPLLSEL